MKITQGSKGQIAVTAFVAAAILVVVVGTAIYFTQKEQEKVKAAETSSIAMKMAEQALSRAVWKIEERVENWEDITEGTALAGYNFNQKYTEGDGEYCIQIASATPLNTSLDDTSSKVVITAVGRDKNGNEVKAIKAIYSNEAVSPGYAVYILNEKKHKRKKRDKHSEYKHDKKSAWLGTMMEGALAHAESLAGSFASEAWASSKKDDDKDDDFGEDQMKGIHWGPVVALGDLKLKKHSSHNKYWLRYPRKMATGNVKGRDQNKESPPNTDGQEWWSYDDSVPSAPELDFDFYRTAAKNGGVVDGVTHFSGGGVYHTKGNGSKCVPSHGKRGGKNEDKKDYDDDNDHFLIDQVDTYGQPKCYFFDDVNCKISGDTYIEGTIIAFNSRIMVKEGKRHSSQGIYTAAVPPDAWGEYLALPDTSASGEYPADAGLNAVNPTYAFDSSNPVTVKGLLYATKEVHLKGNATVHGVVIVGKKFKFDGSGHAQVFYDHTLQLRPSEVSLAMESYNEIRAQWPSGL